MNVDSNTPGCPRWLHALAVLTVLFTLPSAPIDSAPNSTFTRFSPSAT